jgi:diaminopropionate ammonia-lyase family
MSLFRRQPIFNKYISHHQQIQKPSKDIHEFHKKLPGYKPTPLWSLDDIATEFGIKRIFLKDESERVGLPSFKILGASWGAFIAVAAKLQLPHTVSIDDLAASAKTESITLFAATDGNHGRAVAYMARMLTVPCYIYVPKTLDTGTRSFISEEGANIVESSTYDIAVQEATEAAKREKGAILIQDTAFTGYETIPEQIVQGYSTMLMEIDNQLHNKCDQVDLVICPVGVGSLAKAVVEHFKAQTCPAKFVSVEPDTAACLYQSLREGHAVDIRTSNTIMNGMDCGTLSSISWLSLHDNVDISLSISDHEAHLAVQDLKKQNISSGPCGAAGLAALRLLAKDFREQSGLTENSTVVLINTEASRTYPEPWDVSIDDPVVLTQILTRIESTNPSLSVADGTGETAIANYIEAWLQHRDIETHRLETSPGRPSIVGVAYGLKDKKSLMINGHIDTVSLSNYGPGPIAGNLEQRNGREVVLGRGCLDMKAGVAAGMTALARAKQQNSIGTVILAAVADEEDSSRGTQDLIAAGWRADGAIVPEPTNLGMAVAHKGFVWVEIEIQGFAAHGSRADLGVDAILQAAKFILALQSYAETLPEDNVLGKGTMHCGQIKGGDEPSTYPAVCTVVVELRTVSGQTSEGIIKDIREVLTGLSKSDKRFNYAEPRLLLSRAPHRLSPEHPFALAAIAAAESVVGRKISPETFPAWTDAALLGESGIPAVVWGPAGEGLHAEVEFVDVESIRQTEAMMTLLIEDFCKQGLDSD